MTLQDLKKEKIAAMKLHEKDVIAGLNVVISKLMLLEKSGSGEISDADVDSAIRKSIKELREERDSFAKAGRTENVTSLDAQIAAVEKYLPQQLTTQEIAAVIEGLTDKSMPVVMRYFKDNYAGRVDMKQVSELLKKL